jgi:cell division protein FtsQ
VTTLSSKRTRSLVWEDDAPAELGSERVEQSAPPAARALRDLPRGAKNPESAAPRGDDGRKSEAGFDGSGLDRLRQERPRRPWWRPASTAGRFFLLLAAVMVLGGLGVSGYLLKGYLDRDERFRISGAGNIEASGLTEVSRAQMLPVFGEDIGRNIFFVPLSERRKQLEEIPWVERATVMRLLPDRIRVSVVERQPVAFARHDEQFGLVDANGVLLTMPAAMMAQHHYSFPVVTGIKAGDPPAARQARMRVYQRLLAELDANGQKLSEQISEIDLTDLADARVLMPEQGGDILAHFGEDRFLERYQRYKAHIAEWRKQFPKLAGVDLRYDQKVVLEMAPGASVAQEAADEQAAASDEPSAGETAGKGKNVAESPQKHPSGAKQTAEKLGGSGKSGGKLPSEVKASADSGSSGARTPSSLHPSRTSAKAKPLKAGAKPVGKVSAKAKTAAARDKAAKAKMVNLKAKKRAAEIKRAALNVSRQKSTPMIRPATAAGEGQ